MLEILQNQKIFKKCVIFLVWLAILPFFLRIGMDSYVARRQPVLEIYREWRWSSAIKNIKSKSTIVFERRKDLNTDEALFLAQLQRDFKVVPSGDFPAIRAYIEKGTIVRAHIEVLPNSQSPKSEKEIWTGDARFPNNGLLLGIWVGLLLIFLGAKISVGAMVTLAGTLLWSSHWNVLDIPRISLEFVQSLIQEIWSRLGIVDFSSVVLGGLAELSVFIWVFCMAAAIVTIWKFQLPSNRIYLWTVLASFILEPLILMLASKWAQWPDGSSWWKVYLGSFSFRFMTLGLLFFLLLRPYTLDINKNSDETFKPWKAIFLLSLTFTFVMCQGWAWMNSVFIEELPEPILRLKVFLIGFIVATFMGARIFSLWFAILAVALALPPTRGHWNAAAVHAGLMEGLAWGWFLSPFKIFGIWKPLTFQKNSLYFVLAVTWLLGIFLSSVGFPVGVSWVVVLLALWAYRHIDFTETQETIKNN